MKEQVNVLVSLFF